MMRRAASIAVLVLILAPFLVLATAEMGRAFGSWLRTGTSGTELRALGWIAGLPARVGRWEEI